MKKDDALFFVSYSILFHAFVNKLKIAVGTNDTQHICQCLETATFMIQSNPCADESFGNGGFYAYALGLCDRFKSDVSSQYFTLDPLLGDRVYFILFFILLLLEAFLIRIIYCSVKFIFSLKKTKKNKHTPILYNS